MAFQKLCPPKIQRLVAMVTQFLVLMLMIWATALSITDKAALPGGHIFSLLILFTGAVIGGDVFSRIQLPPLLGK